MWKLFRGQMYKVQAGTRYVPPTFSWQGFGVAGIYQDQAAIRYIASISSMLELPEINDLNEKLVLHTNSITFKIKKII